MGELGLAERVLTELRHLVLTKIRGCPPIAVKNLFLSGISLYPPLWNTRQNTGFNGIG